MDECIPVQEYESTFPTGYRQRCYKKHQFKYFMTKIIIVVNTIKQCTINDINGTWEIE